MTIAESRHAPLELNDTSDIPVMEYMDMIGREVKFRLTTTSMFKQGDATKGKIVKGHIVDSVGAGFYLVRFNYFTYKPLELFRKHLTVSRIEVVKHLSEFE